MTTVFSQEAYVDYLRTSRGTLEDAAHELRVNGHPEVAQQVTDRVEQIGMWQFDADYGDILPDRIERNTRMVSEWVASYGWRVFA